MSNLILMLMAKEIRNSSVNGVASVASTQCTNDQQWTKYHSKQGHGFAAEDANAMWDRWHGKSVNKVGLDNSLNGADRISDGVQIQTKYCADAGKSVGAAFENGTYRYVTAKERPQAKAQATDCVWMSNLMESRFPALAMRIASS